MVYLLGIRMRKGLAHMVQWALACPLTQVIQSPLSVQEMTIVFLISKCGSLSNLEWPYLSAQGKDTCYDA